MDDGGARDVAGDDVVDVITRAVDPVLARHGFGPGQGGLNGGPVSLVPTDPLPRVDGQLIWCRGMLDGADGCEDVVMDLVADPSWRVSAVRGWDDPRGAWTHEYAADALEAQLELVVRDLRRIVDGD